LAAQEAKDKREPRTPASGLKTPSRGIARGQGDDRQKKLLEKQKAVREKMAKKSDDAPVSRLTSGRASLASTTPRVPLSQRTAARDEEAKKRLAEKKGQVASRLN
jgi:hypothetical protein